MLEPRRVAATVPFGLEGAQPGEGPPGHHAHIRDCEAGPRPEPVHGIDPDAPPREPAAAPLRRLEAASGALQADAVTLDLDQRRAARCKQLVDAAQEAIGIAADADVAVQQEDRRPLAGSRNVAERRALEHRRPAAPRGAQRRGQDVDAHRLDATRGEFGDVPARATPNVQYGPCRLGEQVELLRCRVGQPALDVEAHGCPIGPEDPMVGGPSGAAAGKRFRKELGRWS